MADNKINVGGRLHSIATGNVLAGADEILDDSKNKKQSEINTETYSLVNDVNAKLDTLSPEQQGAMGVATKANNNEAKLGYYVCETESNVAAKVISDATGYVLSNGGSMKVKMTNANTAENATLNINSTGAKALYYAGERASANNSWEAGETVEIYYDGTSYYANNVVGGSSDGVFDVSVKYPTSGVNGGNAYTLEGALSVLNANLSSNKKKGGMSIKFIQSSDNKYVQYRLTANEWSTDTDDWAIADEGVYVENPEFIYVKTDKDNKILWAIKTDGSIYYGAGVPQQVIDYINEKIAELSLDEYEDIVSFLDDLEKDDKTLQDLLNEKVDKEEGKSLIDAEYASTKSTTTHQEFITLTIDADNKILEGITANGNKQINIPIETPAAIIDSIEDNEFIEAKIDSEGKMLQATEKDGLIRYFGGVGLGTEAEVKEREDSEYIKVITDKEGTVIEGIKKDGSKYVRNVDSITAKTINQRVNISHITSDFISPIPCVITGTKGDDSAKYEFTLPLSKDEWNIRLKFKVTENLLNNNKKASICRLYNTDGLCMSNIIAYTIPLSQYTTSATVDGINKVSYWPTLIGGIWYVNNNGTAMAKRNIGDFAFSIKYIGTEETASIENTGTALILKYGENVAEFPYSQYLYVEDLYKAIKANQYFEVDYKFMETKLTSELAIFPECTLISDYYSGENDSEIFDNPFENEKAAFFVPYAMDNEWHQVEIVKIGKYIYYHCDGCPYVSVYADGYITETMKFIIGGDCNVQFKDIDIDLGSRRDAEVSRNRIISSVNPSIFIMMGHGFYDMSTAEHLDMPDAHTYTSETSMACNPDRLYKVFYELRERGFVPVSMYDIADYHNYKKQLPKRCYCIIFDDFRFVNFVTPRLRRVFREFGVQAGLAVITGLERDIPYNGGTITPKEAADLCLTNGFGLFTHTRNHRKLSSVQPSLYISEMEQDIYSADAIHVDPYIFIYPAGSTNVYVYDCLKWIGCCLGIRTTSSNTNNGLSTDKYELWRYDIGVYRTLSETLSAPY